MTLHNKDFPFIEVRAKNEGYFETRIDAENAGYNVNQIWSVAVSDEMVFTYGPSHHYINVLGYIATEEPHDGDTYYEEPAF